jgi:Glycosyl transferases group 1
MKVLFSTCSPAGYMQPPILGDEQVNCGPDWADDRGPDGRVRSLSTPTGDYDLAAVAAKLPPAQAPDVVVCLVDASWRNTPRNLGAFRCPRVLLVADTHHLRSPLLGMMRYVASEKFDRIVFLYDRHHVSFFQAAGFRNLFWFPGLTFPHSDEAVRRARHAGKRAPHIAFVGQAGRHHPRRARLLSALSGSGLPLAQKSLPQGEALKFYGASLVGFNASLNGDLNLRVFEILASGAALVTDRLAPDSGLSLILGEGRDFLAYGSADELVQLAREAVAQPAKTAAMGAAGSNWFDRHCTAARRRALFGTLAIDGTAVPEFQIDPVEPSRVLFGGDTDRLLRGMQIYEDVQERHRIQETVSVLRGDTAPWEIDALFSTLPRVSIGTAPGAAPADLSVFSRAEPGIASAEIAWCVDARAEDMAALDVRMHAKGYAQADSRAALYRRAVNAAPSPKPVNTRIEGQLLVIRVALQARDSALCRSMIENARREGVPSGTLAPLVEAVERTFPVEAETLCPAGA